MNVSADVSRLDNYTLADKLKLALEQQKDGAYILLLAKEMRARHLMDEEAYNMITRRVDAQTMRRKR